MKPIGERVIGGAKMVSGLVALGALAVADTAHLFSTPLTGEWDDDDLSEKRRAI